MPKRGGPRTNYNNSGGSRFSALKEYHHEHDDRDRERDRDRDHKPRNNTRRVSFKPSLFASKEVGGVLKRRMAELAIRARLEDDEDMGDLATTSKFEDRTHGPRRKGSPIPKGKFGKLVQSEFGWYQVSETIFGGFSFLITVLTRPGKHMNIDPLFKRMMFQ